MGGKDNYRAQLAAFENEFASPPWVLIKVYRRRQDDPTKWKYLSLIELEDEMELEVLESLSAMDLGDLIPLPAIKRRWGGGDYQFRFFWRDEQGRKEQKRSRNVRIGGLQKPSRRNPEGS
jgi:hypothetical protein